MKKKTKYLFIVMLAGSFALSAAGCGTNDTDDLPESYSGYGTYSDNDNGDTDHNDDITETPVPSQGGSTYHGSNENHYDEVDPDDHDIEGYYEDHEDEYDDYDDAYDGFEDDEDAWEDY